MPGPQEQRLIQALHGADGSRSFSQGREWFGIGRLLRDVAKSLGTAEPPAHGGEAGALTAEAMKAAFAKSAEAMHKRADHVATGEQALLDAGGALEDADADYQALGPEGTAPSYTPHEDPGSEEGIKQRNDYLSAQKAFEAEQARREEAARIAADKLEERLHKAADVMAGLHDQQATGGGGTGGGGGYPAGAATGGGGATSGTKSGTARGVLTSGPHPTVGGDFVPSGNHGGEGRDPGGPRVDYVPGSPHPNAGGTPAEIADGSIVPVAGVGSGSGGGLTLGPAGVVAGGAAAGIIGAKLGGALRGVLAGGAGAAGSSAGGAAGAVGRGGTAASAVRGIGATAKSAGASTLGRSATSAAAGRAAGGGTAGRPGTAGNGAGRAGSRAGATGAGRGGGRAGAPGAGRGGRRDKDEDGLDHETFDVGEDWVGDDDAGPGVLS